MNGENKMIIEKKNDNAIDFKIDGKVYNIIKNNGQMDLKSIYTMVKENYDSKDKIKSDITFCGEITDEIKKGLKIFVNNLFDKFKKSDFESSEDEL